MTMYIITNLQIASNNMNSDNSSNNDFVVGGPPILSDMSFSSMVTPTSSLESLLPNDKSRESSSCPSSSSAGCAGTQTFYDKMQHAIDCVCGSTGSTGGSLCTAVATGQLANQQPFSSMIDLLTGPYSQCGAAIPAELRQDAYNTFSNITGYVPDNITTALTILDDNQKTILRYTAFYMFVPLFILSVIVIWLLVGFSWITWPVGLFATVMVFVVLYSFSLLYRIHAQTWLESRTSQIINTQSNFQDTVAYWPQGFFGIASTLNDSSWVCNNPTNVASTQEVSMNNSDTSNISNMSELLAPSASPDISSISSKLSLEDISEEKLHIKPGKDKKNKKIKGSKDVGLVRRFKKNTRKSSRFDRLR